MDVGSKPRERSPKEALIGSQKGYQRRSKSTPRAVQAKYLLGARFENRNDTIFGFKSRPQEVPGQASQKGPLGWGLGLAGGLRELEPLKRSKTQIATQQLETKLSVLVFSGFTNCGNQGNNMKKQEKRKV